MVSTVMVVLNLLVLAPVMQHLLADLLSSRSRDFSFVPHRGTHAWWVLAALITMPAMLMLPVSPEEDADLLNAAFLTVPLSLALVFRNGPTRRRLIVEADTGLISWVKLWLPTPWQRDAATTYFDDVGALRKDSRGDVDLFGLAKLDESYFDGEGGGGGTFDAKELTRLVESYHAYREAFVRHDSDQAKARRARFRQQREERLAPERARRAAKRAAAEEQAQQQKQEAASEHEARERARLERLREQSERKFK